jgi:hypothetical protein
VIETGYMPAVAYRFVPLTEKSPEPMDDSVTVPIELCPSPQLIDATKSLAAASVVKSRKDPTTWSLACTPAVALKVVGIGERTGAPTKAVLMIVVVSPGLKPDTEIVIGSVPGAAKRLLPEIEKSFGAVGGPIAGGGVSRVTSPALFGLAAPQSIETLKSVADALASSSRKYPTVVVGDTTPAVKLTDAAMGVSVSSLRSSSRSSHP